MPAQKYRENILIQVEQIFLEISYLFTIMFIINF